LYTLLNETNAACSQILFQSESDSILSATAESATGRGESSGDQAKAEVARAAIQEGAEKLVMAMVNQVWPACCMLLFFPAATAAEMV